MPLLTVITAAYKPNPTFLAEAWRSLVESRGLAEWEWEWCVQEDGNDPSARELLQADERIRYGSNMVHAGASATRNAAIARAKGEWIVNLDYDDFFTPDGLSALVEAWSSHPQAVWAAGRAHDYIDDERRFVEFPDYLEPGVVTADDFMSSWKLNELLPVHFSSAAMRTTVMRALGGYFAAPVGEDTNLWLAATHMGDGVYTSEPVFSYRRWSGQSTKQDTCVRWNGAAAVHQRLDALRELGVYPGPRPTQSA